MAREGELAGSWRITGVWSHFACSDEPDHPANDAQEEAFRDKTLHIVLEVIALTDAAAGE
mgnify:CR=1 FL=1